MCETDFQMSVYSSKHVFIFGIDKAHATEVAKYSRFYDMCKIDFSDLCMFVKTDCSYLVPIHVVISGEIDSIFRLNAVSPSI